MTYDEAVDYVEEVFEYWRVNHINYDANYDQAKRLAVEALKNMAGMLAKSGGVFKLNIDDIDAKYFSEQLNTKGNLGLWQTPPVTIETKPFDPIATYKE